MCYTTTYTYDANDANNRLISEVSNKSRTTVLTSYTYDDNGNLESQLDVNSTAAVHHSYNGFNQLVSSVTGEGTITYTYNAQGIRTSRTVGLLTTHYLLDGGNVIGEVEGNETYTYVRGINLIFGRARYYLYNAHGDVVQLTNTNGQLTKNYNYDAFGNERSPDEGDTNPFRYCGEYYDTETGLYYLRARYYDPLIGRFTQEDTHWNTANMIYGDNPQKINEREDALGLKHYSYAPQISAISQSGNLYVYTANNPVFYADPSGNFALSTLAILMIGGALIGALFGGIRGYNKANQAWLTGWDRILCIVNHALNYAIIGTLISYFFGAATGLVGADTAPAFNTPRYYTPTGQLGGVKCASWQSAEQWVRDTYNAVKHTFTKVPEGMANRIVDGYNANTGTIYEVKYGYYALTEFVRSEIIRDAHLLTSGQVTLVEWHFFVSQVTGNGGPSGPLLEFLIEMGIKVVFHSRRRRQ